MYKRLPVHTPLTAADHLGRLCQSSVIQADKAGRSDNRLEVLPARAVRDSLRVDPGTNQKKLKRIAVGKLRKEIERQNREHLN